MSRQFWEGSTLCWVDSHSLPILKKLASQIRVPGTWISASLVGDGVTYSMLVLVDAKGRVVAVLVETDFDSG